ncbi:extracellular solute-binding protein [Oceanobacillus sp. 143]|uniref:Sugar ABC transporter substrate-binding protein n=1 Tax=Oceanobacillus zhaokaii TaxID=2052660 RepID=A0A345PKC7_9BACI|nr:sugar ABC transporter substrate-binding protein [Oceanobacillus zhaokaii]AXI10457.1 sugar ABC transporter substrate-binding protein [Oceanobacillus zhaokaii]QGS69471.1 extracellular solute-binding protein [Oceanobacillus sp. 143]
MKKLVLGVFIVMLAVFLAACSSSSSGSNKQVLEVALWDENVKDTVNASIEAFNEKHPDVEVKVTYTPYANYWTKLKTSIGGSSGPDVFWMNGPNFYKYSTDGLIKNLEPLIKEDDEFNKDAYVPAVVDLYSMEDELYAAPYFTDSVGLYYNKQLFDDAGVDYPDESWTWEDIETEGEKLVNKDEGVFGYAAHTTVNQQGYYNLIHQAGGYVISEDRTKSGFDSPESKEAFAFLKNLIDKGISPSTQNQIETESKQLFMSNKLAMIPLVSVNTPELHEALGDKLGVAPLPKGKQAASIVHGIGWAMNDKVEDEELAWDLIKSLTSEQANKDIAESGFSIPAMQSTGDIWLNSVPSVDLQVFLDAQENGGAAYPISERTTEWQDIETKEIQQAFLEGTSIDEALDRIAEGMNKILEEENND